MSSLWIPLSGVGKSGSCQKAEEETKSVCCTDDICPHLWRNRGRKRNTAGNGGQGASLFLITLSCMHFLRCVGDRVVVVRSFVPLVGFGLLPICI